MVLLAWQMSYHDIPRGDGSACGLGKRGRLARFVGSHMAGRLHDIPPSGRQGGRGQCAGR